MHRRPRKVCSRGRPPHSPRRRLAIQRSGISIAFQFRRRTVIPITDDVAIDEREVEERFVRASGPGGQNVNKVSTAVELRFDVSASSLPSEVKARLLVLGASRVTADGVL